MCGRFELIDGQRVFIRFRIPPPSPYAQHTMPNNADVRPTQQILTITADHQLSSMQWGLVPAWAHDPGIGSRMINARSEGIDTKASFKKPLRFQRCIIPASAFFEWKGRPGAKVKYRIGRRDADLVGLAGLYEVWRAPHGQELTTCTIITTTPNAVVAPIHDRMPVILLPDEEEEWLNPDRTGPAELLPLLKPYPAELLEAHAA